MPCVAQLEFNCAYVLVSTRFLRGATSAVSDFLVGLVVSRLQGQASRFRLCALDGSTLQLALSARTVVKFAKGQENRIFCSNAFTPTRIMRKCIMEAVP